MLLCERIPSPLGMLLLAYDGDRLCALDYAEFEPRMRCLLRRRFGDRDGREGQGPERVPAALAAYFAGDLAALSAVPVALGGTLFPARVWAALRAIPPGTTTHYGALAAGLGCRSAARAVAHANAQNPAAIIVPCHRLVGANGALTGYAGGLDRKRWLLSHEGALPACRRDAADDNRPATEEFTPCRRSDSSSPMSTVPW